ncbi:MAG: class I SAM-dependent methyltransferase [Bacillota bacterium]
MKDALSHGDWAIDATAGNGSDTLFLAQLVGDAGHVYSFDIQSAAIARTKELLNKHGLNKRVTLINSGHQNMDKYVKKEVKAVIFNLGYLPRGDHAIVTTPVNTVTALKKSISLLQTNGIISAVVYSGHCGGEDEKIAVEEFFSRLDKKDYDVIKTYHINRKATAPFILVAQKLTNKSY